MRFFVVHIQIGLCRAAEGFGRVTTSPGSPKISHDSPVIQRAWAFDVSTMRLYGQRPTTVA